MASTSLNLVASLLAACVLFGADNKKKIEPAFAQSEVIDLTAQAFLDKAEIDSLLGVSIDKGIYLVRVTVRPKGEKPVRIALDDFTLLKQDDGQRTTPFAPSQIAATSGLTLQSQRMSGWGSQGNGPVWGGIGGGRPSRMPGNGGAVGNSTASVETVTATEKESTKPAGAANPVLDALKAKGLPEKETSDPVEGFLYFPIDGKVKLKDLLLIYKAPGGKMELRFISQK